MKISLKSIKQSLMIGGSMTISLNGVERAWLGNGDQETINAEEGEIHILIKSGLREKNIIFQAKQDVNISIKWNRISGKIETLINGSDVKLIQE